MLEASFGFQLASGYNNQIHRTGATKPNESQWDSRLGYVVAFFLIPSKLVVFSESSTLCG